MSKTFFVAPGHEAVNRGVRHGAGLLLAIEEGESVEVFATGEAGSATSLGTFQYAQLNKDAPPVGLLRDHRHDTASYDTAADRKSAAA